MNIKKFKELNTCSKLAIIALFASLALMLVVFVMIIRTVEVCEYVGSYYDGRRVCNLVSNFELPSGRLYCLLFLGIIAMLVVDIITNNKVMKYIIYPCLCLNVFFVWVTWASSRYGYSGELYPCIYIALVPIAISLIFALIGKFRIKITKKEKISKENVFKSLKRLKEMYDDGIITKEEYEEKRVKYVEYL